VSANEVLQDIIEAIAAGNFVVCPLRCWACIANQCPGGPHAWADPDDIQHAAKTAQPDPSSESCGCFCVREEPRTMDGPDLDDYGPGEIALSQMEPCPECDAVGACAWDSEGRPLIHARMDGDDE